MMRTELTIEFVDFMGKPLKVEYAVIKNIKVEQVEDGKFKIPFKSFG